MVRFHRSLLPFGHETRRFQRPGHRAKQLSREPLGGGEAGMDFDTSELKSAGDLKHPAVYFQGRVCLFYRPNGFDCPHVFGGPLPGGLEVAPGASLHSVLTISRADCDVLEESDFESVPLIFPFQHDSGLIQYCISKSGNSEIDSLEPPESSDDWPYEGYPRTFPVQRMRSSQALPISKSDFEALLWQGFTYWSDQLAVAVIPPNASYGVSLWGEHGDAELVQCVFYIDVVTGEIKAENQCG